MGCEVKVTANGNPSILFNELNTITNNVETAHKLYMQTSKPDFANWFGNSNNVDTNGEPKIYNENGIYVFKNDKGELKAVNNKGTFGKQYKSQDVINYLANENIVTKKKFENSYWIRKGITIDGDNELDYNLGRLDRFNEVYYKEYGVPLVFAHKDKTSYKVEVNELLLSLLNTRNDKDIYFSAIDDLPGDMNRQVINTFSTSKLNEQEEKYGINIISSVIIASSKRFSQLSVKDAIEGKTVRKELHKALVKKFNTALKDNKITKPQYDTNIKVAETLLSDNLFWNKIKKDVQYNSGYIITELEEIQLNTDNLTNSFDENQQFKVSPEERVRDIVKKLVNTNAIVSKTTNIENNSIVYSKDVNTPGGFPIMMRFSDVSDYLVQIIHDSNSVQEMLEDLEFISNNINPSYRNIVSKLKRDANLKNAFWSSFKTEGIERIATTINPNSKKGSFVTIDTINKNSYLAYQIADNWINTLSMYKSGNFYESSGTINDIILTYSAYNRAKGEPKLDLLDKFFRLAGINIGRNIIEGVVGYSKNRDIIKVPEYIKDKKEIEEYITTSVINNIFGLVVTDTYKYINYSGDINTILDEVKILGNLLKLAKNVRLYYNPINSSYLNVTRELEQTFNKPTFIADWYNMMKDDVVFLNHLKNMLRNPKTKYSTWLLSLEGKPGFLKLRDGLKLSNLSEAEIINSVELNKDFYYDATKDSYKFNLEFFDGVSYVPTNTALRYTDIKGDDWNYIGLANYVAGAGTKFTRYFGLTPSDRGNTRIYVAPRIELKSTDIINNTTIKTSSALYRAIKNNLRSEIARVEAEYRFMFDDKGNVKQKVEDLYLNYHYKVDSNNNPIFIDKNGFPVGDAFKIHNFDYVDSSGNAVSINNYFMDIHDNSIFNDPEAVAIIDNYLSKFIKSLVIDELNNNAKIKDNIYNHVLKPKELNYDNVILEYALNKYIFNNEMLNFFMGDVAFYGSPNKAYKRATQLLASGTVNAGYNSYQTYNAVTSVDRYISHDKFVANLARNLKSKGISQDEIDAIVKVYKNIESTNAQSYITLDEFERRSKLFGVYDKYEELISKARNSGSNLSSGDLNEFFNALKNFYYAYEFDGTRFVPNQVKNSEQVLIPAFIKDTELEEINKVMLSNDVGQLNFMSAEKVGTKYPAKLVNEDGSIIIDKLDSEFKLAKRKYYYKNLRKQQEAVNHIADTTNKLGVQIAKKIIDNVFNDVLINELFSLYVANIEESSANLLEYLGITRTGNAYTINKNKLSEILIDAGIDRGFSNYTIEGFELVDGEFKLPLDHITNRKTNESMINSMFNNRVINQKFPGGHGPQMSDAFMRKLKNGKVDKSSDLKYTQHRKAGGELVYEYAEIKLPYWSKRFFAADDEGRGIKYDTITIEQLAVLGLDTMLGYRIPTEDKHSMVIFKVVAFLEEAAGSTIVVPAEFSSQTGSDFDFDTIFTMVFSFKRNPNGTIHKIEYSTTEERLEERYINYVNDNYRGPVKKDISDELRAEAESVYNEYRDKRNTELKNIEEAALEEIQNIMEFVRSSANKRYSEDVLSYVENWSSTLSAVEMLRFLTAYVDERINILDSLNKDNDNNYDSNKDLYDKFIILDVYLKDSIGYINGLSDNIEALNEQINAKMQDEHWNPFSLNIAKRTASLIGLESIEEFAQRPVELQNTKKARDNRILEIYIQILKDFSNYLEVVTPSSNFTGITSSRDKAESIYNKYGNVVNYATPYAQNVYRNKSLSGRKLKGASVNRDSFLSVAQRIGLQLKYGVKYKFDTSKYKLKDLRKIYGRDNVTKDGVVTLTRFGNNAAGTFTNILGKLITSYSAQSTANILDSVAEPLPYNVNDYTFNVWRILPEIGGTWDMATFLINQEVVSRLIEADSNNSSLLSDKYFNPIDKVRNDLLKQFVYLMKDDTNFTDKYQDRYIKKYIKRIEEYGISASVPIELLNAIYSEYYEEKDISDEYLLDNLKQYATNKTPIQERDYILDQLNILNYYQYLNEIAYQIGDFQTITSFDKKPLGPQFYDNEYVNDVITKVNSDTYNNILIVEDGRTYYDAIYDDIDSLYPSLNSYYKNGFKLAEDIFREEFITNSLPFRRLIKNTPRQNKDFMLSYTMAHVLQGLPFFNNTNVNQLLGANNVVEDIDLNIINDENVAKFRNLSAANKLHLVKKYYNEFIQNDNNNVLNHINPIINIKYFTENKSQGISFVLDKVGDNLISSFNNMWYNNNPYYHLLAQDLVKYAYFRYGLNFGRNISKLIPTSVLYKEPTTIKTINGINIINGIGYSSYLQKERLTHFTQPIDYGLYHRIKFARANHTSKMIVPKLDRSKEYGYPEFVGNPNLKGIVYVSSKQFYKLSKKVRQADVVERWVYTGKDTKPKRVLYAKIPKEREVDGRIFTEYYYVPVNPLEKYEFTESSRIEENNEYPSIDTYLDIIDRHTAGKGDQIVNDNKDTEQEQDKPNHATMATVDRSLSWGDLENMEVFTERGVNVMRTKAAENNQHFGNPFTANPNLAKGNSPLVLKKDTNEASQAYKDWLMTDKYDRAYDIFGNTTDELFKRKQWIINQINSGALDGATLLYMKEKGDYYSHAHALADIINTRTFNDNWNKSGNFQGYKGGYSSKGQGTPQGDEKDAAMRKIADGFIGEYYDINPTPSSTYTSYKEISDKSSSLGETLGRTYKDGSNKSRGYGIKTNYDNPIAGRVIMLARNGKLRGTSLTENVKKAILDANNAGSEFIVGDMVGVDSQFIDYLKEIKAKFTVYHNGTKSRIAVENNQVFASIDDVLVDRLPDRLQNFLKTLNFTVDFRNDLKGASPYNALSFTDLLHKAIFIRNDFKEQGLVYETAYVAYSMLGRTNKIRTDLMSSIESMEDYAEKFKEYTEDNPSLNEYKVKELIVIDYLADAIKNNYQLPKDSYIHRKADYWKLNSKTKLGKKVERLLMKIKIFVKRLFSIKLTEEEVQTLLDDIANDVLKMSFDKFPVGLTPEEQQRNYNDTVAKDPEAVRIITGFQNIGLLNTGSTSLRLQGTIYRSNENAIHDLDFSLEYQELNSMFQDVYEEVKAGAGKNTSEDTVIAYAAYIMNSKEFRKRIAESTIIKEIKDKFPKFKVTKVFKQRGSSEYTLMGEIDKYHIDIFFTNSVSLASADYAGFQDWKPIFEAKIKMGRLKDLKDLVNYKPYNIVDPSTTNLDDDFTTAHKYATISGIRHFKFGKIENDLNTVYASINDLSEEDDEFINYNQSIIDHIRAITSDYNLSARLFPDNKNLKTVSRRLKNITYDSNLTSSVTAAIRADADYAYRAVKEMEKLLYNERGYISKAKIFDAVKNPAARVEFTSYMNYANSFLKGFARIANLEQLKHKDLTDDEKELNKAIARLTSLSPRINELKATHNTIMKLYFETLLTPLSTNPEVKLGIRRMFDVQSDESKIQLFLDALIDTNHTFVANLIKSLYVDNGINAEAIKSAQTEFDKKMEEFKANGFNIEDIIESSNKLIQEFDETYKEDLDELVTKLLEIEEQYGKYSTQYYNAEKVLEAWKLNNLTGEELDEVRRAKFAANDILYRNPEARKEYDMIIEKRRNILNNYKGVMDYSVITIDDSMELAALEREMNELANKYDHLGNMKSGKYLEIANVITEYKEALSKVFEDYYQPIIEIEEFKEFLEKYKKEDTKEAKQWLINNTKVQIRPEFWDDFKKYGEILGKEEAGETILKALKPYQDKNGIINGTSISPQLRDKIKAYNEGNMKDSEPRAPKAVRKPKNNEVYNQKYRDMFELYMGWDDRDDNDKIVEARKKILTILLKPSYITEDGLLNTTAISKDDYNEIIRLEDIIKYESISYEVSLERDGFNTWFNNTHKAELDRVAFNNARKIAAKTNKSYLATWEAANTELHIETEYYELLEKLREKHNIKRKITRKQKEADSRKVSYINLDHVRRFFKVESITELPKEVSELIYRKKNYTVYDSVDKVYSLSDYLVPHKLLRRNEKSPDSRVFIDKTKKDAYIKAANFVKDLYKARLEAESRSLPTAKKTVMYNDEYYDMHTRTTTKEYNRLLAKNGVDSKWYRDNHIINHRGEIVPAHYWVIERPKDKKLFEENAPAKKYWGYNTVTDKSYVDTEKTKAKTWQNENVDYVNTSYYNAVKANNKKLMTEEEYSIWFDNNHYYNTYSNTYEPISIWTAIMPSDTYIDKYAPIDYAKSNEIKEEYKNPDYRSINDRPLPKKSSKYYNKNFETAYANPLYQYLDGLLNNLVDHYKYDTIIGMHQLPIMYKKNKDVKSEMMSNILKDLGFYKYSNREIVGENNESVHIINMPYVSNLIEEELIELPNEKEFSTRKAFLERYNEVRRQNKEIREKNKAFNDANMNNDWENVIRAFIASSMKHEFMINKEHEMKLALEQIRNLDLAKRKNILETLKNITRIKLGKEKPDLYEGDTGLSTVKGINSNVEQHFRLFMNMVFYGEFQEDEGNWTQIAKVLQNFTSAKGMWLNAPGAFNNVAYGRTQMALEHFSGYFYNKRDALQADKMYMGAVFNMLSETGKETSNSFTNALIKKFDIIELQDELAINSNRELDRSIKKRLMSTNSLYFMHHMGEHYMQNIALLAMLNSHRLVGDKVQSFADYTFDIQYKALLNVLDNDGKHALDKFIRDNKFVDEYFDGKSDLIRDFILKQDNFIRKEFLTTLKDLKNEAKTEFDNYTRLVDIYELKDGIASVKEGYDISDTEFQLFKLKVIKVNQKVHGIYNKFDAGTIQRYAIGRLAVQFKKWLRPGFIKRYGTRTGKSFWNEARSEKDVGMYVSTFKFLTKPIFDGIKEAKGQDAVVLSAIANIFNAYKDYIANIGIYWHTLTDTDKANIRRTMVETLEFAFALSMLWLLRALADGEDDDKKWAYGLYAIDRLRTEILAYNPFYGFTNEGRKLFRDPFAAMGLIEDASKLVYVSLFENDVDYKGGIYHGESKVHVQLFKNIPLLNRALRFENIQDYAGYYKLY